MCEAFYMITLFVYSLVDGLALLFVFEEESIKRGDFGNLMGRNLCASMKMEEVKAHIFPLIHKQIKTFQLKKL